jgi:hypothetical protein
MKKLFIILSMTVCALNTSAQTYLEHLQTREAGKGNVTVIESREIDELVNGSTPNNLQNKKQETAAEKKTAFNAKNETAPRNNSHEENTATDITTVDTSRKVMRNGYRVTGYRVQVYAGGNSRADKNKAESIGNQIKSHFPNQPVYVHFYSPRWICRMGNFRTYEEAQEMLRKVREAGFRQASLVKGKITVSN